MWPFKKRQKDIQDLPSDDLHRWTVLQSESDDGPMLIRRNDTAKDWAKHPSLNIRVGFAVPLNSPKPGELPDPDENLILNDIEDALCKFMKATGPSIQVLVVATGTFKEFVFYMNNGEGIESAHKNAIAAFPDYNIQCYGENDPNWESYLQWV